MIGNRQLRIGLSGKAKTGKNTVADLIVTHLDLNRDEYRIRAFADPMKEIMKIMFPGADNECLYGASELREKVISNKFLNRDFHRKPLTYRSGLTDIGKYAREYNENIWIYNLDYDLNNWVPNIDRTSSSRYKSAYIVSDCRFINEFNYLREQGFYLIRILRKGTNSGIDVSEVEQEQIPNESFDKVIHNDYSIDVLSEEVRQIINELCIK